ncbi:acetoacetate-CoA ligase [Colletotrichum truncatum]|uniref:Acetoacetate-CoA ligase n=1 Tax=Colletotrichum truncatum TaxID=5467 RepID=A0ACC3ZK99_COLTU|nr:acetoacetate-CoA ligase [Colletotrichum truncatum]KAF6799937.1 acetoacetate-CoA ligase [Colletotrichum truncatum]
MAKSNPQRLLWKPVDLQHTRLWELMETINRAHNLSIKVQKPTKCTKKPQRLLFLQNYAQLHHYSITQPAQFWLDCFGFLDIIHTGSYFRSVDECQPIDSMSPWFEGVSLNFTENILYEAIPGESDAYRIKGKEDDKIAVTEVREGLEEIRHIDWATLRADTGRLASALKARNIGRGDRIFAVASNSYATLTLFLATAWLGGIFSSVASDMGIVGILERTKQITPKLIFVDNYAQYQGKYFDLAPKIQQIVKATADSASLEGVVLIPRYADKSPQKRVAGTRTLAGLLSSASMKPPSIERLPFSAPALICYSSGTTEQPKCIVHSVGGIVLNGAKEGVLHTGIGPNSVSFQYTTTGWIMYLACVLSLQSGARTILYDGSPFTPDLSVLLKVVAQEKVTVFGTSPKWMGALVTHKIAPRVMFDLSALEVVTSTGMVLPDQLFEWFYGPTGFPPNVRLSNMSGGTDIAGCFLIGNPISPLYVGGCQGPALGIDVQVYDATATSTCGKPVPDGIQGELVAVKPFPNVPILFWNDIAPPSSPNSKLFSSYFARFDHVWTQGDIVSLDRQTRAIIHHGRADGVLNPSGIRFGSAEVYNVIEKRFGNVVLDSLCVGQRRPSDSDESVLLFLQMRPGETYDDKLVTAVKAAIRQDLSSRHVSKYIFQTPEIPMTATFKKLELPVKAIVSGKMVTPSSAVMNPGSLEFFHQFVNIENLVSHSKL